MSKTLFDSIPGVSNGEWIFKGTTVTVDSVKAYVRSGHTLEEALEAFPGLTQGHLNQWLEAVIGPAWKRG